MSSKSYQRFSLSAAHSIRLRHDGSAGSLRSNRSYDELDCRQQGQAVMESWMFCTPLAALYLRHLATRVYSSSRGVSFPALCKGRKQDLLLVCSDHTTQLP